MWRLLSRSYPWSNSRYQALSHFIERERCQMFFSWILLTVCSSVIFRSNSKSLSVHTYNSPLSCAIVVVVEPLALFFRSLIGQHAAHSLRLYHQLSVWRVLDGMHVWLRVDGIIETYWQCTEILFYFISLYFIHLPDAEKMCFANYPRTYGHGLSFICDVRNKWNEKLT